MIRVETLTESRAKTIELSDEQAAALQSVGLSMAGDPMWWGASDELSEEESKTEPSIVRCTRLSGRQWQVRVHNAVGMIAVENLQLEIQPKIPLNHLVYLMERSQLVPRMDDVPVAAASDDTLGILVIRWYLAEVKRLLQLGLSKGYQEQQARLRLIRGSIDGPSLARDFYRGRLEFECRYEEFDYDTPLNRVVKAAAESIAANRSITMDVRQTALRIVRQLPQVSALQHRDTAVEPDRLTNHYRNPWLLARHVLAATGRTIATGSQPAWAFLIPTPLLVESGIRHVLRDQFGSRVHPTAGKMKLPPTNLSVNPDLVFDQGASIGDVKYKVGEPGWHRSELNQLVTFAAAYRAQNSVVIRFTTSEPVSLDLDIGVHTLRNLQWDARTTTKPSEAESKLVESVGSWLSGVVEGSSDLRVNVA